MSLTNLMMNFVASLNFLNLQDPGNPTQQDDNYASFSAHVAWSIVMPLASLSMFGHMGMYITCALWLANWIAWKMVDRGHWALIVSGKESGTDLQNLIVNFFSNQLIPIIFVVVTLLR